MWTPNKADVKTYDPHLVSEDEYNDWQKYTLEALYDPNEYEIVRTPDFDKKQYNCHFYAWHNNQGHEKWSGENNI